MLAHCKLVPTQEIHRKERCGASVTSVEFEQAISSVEQQTFTKLHEDGFYLHVTATECIHT